MQILIVDDHSLFRTGLRLLLKQRLNSPVVLEADSAQQALQCEAPTLDLVLLDIQLPGLNGLDAIGLFQRQWPAAPVVVLSSSLNPQDASRALARGAAAFLSKAETDKKIVQIVAHAMGLAKRQSGPLAQGEAQASVSPALTPRQQDILGLLCEGLSNKVIARRLALSEFTVRGHVQAVLHVLQVSSRSQAIVAARRVGWFE